MLDRTEELEAAFTAVHTVLNKIKELATEKAADRDDDSPAHFLADDILDILKEAEK